jgi:P27 family predicted phage terminase small subunit
MGNRNSGRKPTPTALKLLQGVTRKDRLNPNEPQPTGDVVKPKGLSRSAAIVWDDIAPICLAMKTLTVADVPAFASLCELQATFNAAAEEKSRDGFSPFLHTTMVDSAGNEHQNVKEHPAIRLERNTAAALRPYYDYFGMTPSGRAKIHVPKAEQPASKWAGALA